MKSILLMISLTIASMMLAFSIALGFNSNNEMIFIVCLGFAGVIAAILANNSEIK